tara:strand:+ start:604 stop:855 length:252 start_codon:yes stop_codon:yes gene_type:complete
MKKYLFRISYSRKPYNKEICESIISIIDDINEACPNSERTAPDYILLPKNQINNAKKIIIENELFKFKTEGFYHLSFQGEQND